MIRKMNLIYLWWLLSLLYMIFFVYDYMYWEFTQNEVTEIKKDMDINRLPKIIYNDETVDKLYDSISLKKEYNNNNK